MNQLIKARKQIGHIAPAMQLARQDAINQMCKGEYDTDYFRALANVHLDYQEGKITKEEYERVTRESASERIDELLKDGSIKVTIAGT